MSVIAFEPLTVTEAQEYESLWATTRALFPDLDDARIALIISIAVCICPHCHDDPVPCACTWDE